MQQKTMGSTGLQTIPFALGGNVFGWTSHAPDAFRILDAFVDAGGSLIDTADVYSVFVKGHVGGESEALIGEWLRHSGKRDKVLIATKVGLLPGEGGKGLQPSRIRAAVDASLKRLGTDVIDIYFAHADDPDTPLDDSLATFDALVREGKVRHLGASQYTPARLSEALAVAAQRGYEPFRVVQPELSLVARDSYQGPLQALCRENDLGVITYFSLAAGFLSGKYRSKEDLAGRERRHRVANYLNERGLAVLAAMDAISAETGLNLPQIAIAWVIAQPGVTAPIASATSLDQLGDLMSATDVTLSPQHLARLDAAGDTEIDGGTAPDER